MWAGHFAYCWTMGHSESHSLSPFLGRQLCWVLQGYSVQHLAPPAVVPKATWLPKCHAGNGSLGLICPWTRQRNKFGVISHYICPVLYVRGIQHRPANTHDAHSCHTLPLHSRSLSRGQLEVIGDGLGCDSGQGTADKVVARKWLLSIWSQCMISNISYVELKKEPNTFLMQIQELAF